MRNCDGETNPNFLLSWAPGLMRCPWSQIEPEARTAIGWHHDYTRLRVLPFGGSDLMRQPAYVYEAIRAVDDALLDVDAHQARVQQEADEKAKADLEQAQRDRDRENRRRGR